MSSSEFLRNLRFIKTKRSMFKSRCKFYRKLFSQPPCVAIVCVLQQRYYSAERVQEPQQDEALCDNCEELKAVNYYP